MTFDLLLTPISLNLIYRRSHDQHRHDRHLMILIFCQSIHRLPETFHDHCLACCFVVRGESPGCRLFGIASMLEWFGNLLPHHSQGSITERWSRNTLRVVTARVFYVLRVTSPFILNNSVETAAPFNVISHPRCSEPRNESLEKVSTSYGVRTCERWHQVPGA